MSAGDGLRLFMVLAGLVILCMTTVSLARKHMTESFCIAWGFVAVMAIFGGIVLRPTEWSRFISWRGLVLAIMGIVFMLAGAFYFTVRISRLTREVRELAIQVSLLNNENAKVIAELTEKSGANKR